MTLTPPLALAHQVRLRSIERGIDHLKLQKLCFYTYGAALGLGVPGTERLEFEAWKHGPVNRAVWDEFKALKGEQLPHPDATPTRDAVGAELAELLDDVVEVYGRMSSWAIRCETHLETPWLTASRRGGPLVDEEIRAHFATKFAPGRVMLPAYLGASQSAAVDGIPRARFGSLHEMANALRERSK